MQHIGTVIILRIYLIIDKHGVLNTLVRRKIYTYVNICDFFCSIGTVIIELPDTCKKVQEGCDQVAVSKADENQPCEGPISAVEG